ncbi:DUF2079 domain-containing protein [Sporolactobacillus shoreae]|uniref:DUF2079 domain-containing protein n=1 Tax=Sporolactobacillus shoreae TaxID=1465501 RepID=A0A4Z0GNJ2_9BACL|nr:glycosyltransferase family 39 protein [Sporolactobacillus shoreae]TGA98480.1 DUF2079 domain-containing protein [Sporolactobacillus shoreae]
MAFILRLKQGLTSLFSIAFALCFLAVLIVSFLFPLIYRNNQDLLTAALLLALFASIVICFFLAFCHFLGSLTSVAVYRVSIVLLTVMAIAEIALIAAFNTILPPIIDGGHTYAEALYLLQHHHASGNAYFKIYPNNIPITLLRYFLYRPFALVHFSNYMIIDRIFCAFVMGAGIFIAWRLVRKIADERTACIFLLMTLTCLPLFFYTLYFYTDTVIMAFPALLLYLWYRYSQSKNIGFILLLGLTLGIGDLIRPNLILFLPALIIYMFFVLNWKKVLLNTVLIGVVLGMISLSTPTIERHFGYISDPSLDMPTTHWIMMGLSHDGAYNAHDFNLTLSQPDQTAKKQADLQLIKERISTDGLSGLVKTWGIKTARTWGAGSHNYFTYAHISTNPTTAYQYLFNDQKGLTLFIIQVFYIVNLLLLLFSVIRGFKTRQADLNLLIQICLFGNFLFYVFVWEAEPRYSLLFTPFILISSAFGLRDLADAVQINKSDHLRHVPVMNTLKLITVCVLLAAVLLSASAGLYDYTQAKQPQDDYIVNQIYAAGKENAVIDAKHSVAQTFRAFGPYNHILLFERSARGKGLYQMSISDEKTGRVLFTQKFRISRIRMGRNLDFIIPRKTPNDAAEERIRLTQLNGSRGSKLQLQMNGAGPEIRDLYPSGYLMENGVHQGQADLRFKVFQSSEAPYLKKTTYWSLISLPILMLVFIGWIILRRTNEEPERIREYPALKSQAGQRIK